jgi:hypothetical protein
MKEIQLRKMMLVQFKNYDVGKINDEKTTI